jgi:hypothetical protein
MKYKVKKNKKTGEVLLSYVREKDKRALRFDVFTKIFRAYPDDITLVIDTNRCEIKFDIADIETVLNSSGIHYIVQRIEGRPMTLLGMNMPNSKKKKQSERMYVLDIKPPEFTRELFDGLLFNYDIALGINKKLTFDELSRDLQALGFEEILFNDEYFEHSVYDGALFQMLRTYIDLTKILD